MDAVESIPHGPLSLSVSPPSLSLSQTRASSYKVRSKYSDAIAF